jgi:hypothetical protein
MNVVRWSVSVGRPRRTRTMMSMAAFCFLYIAGAGCAESYFFGIVFEAVPLSLPERERDPISHDYDISIATDGGWHTLAQGIGQTHTVIGGTWIA